MIILVITLGAALLAALGVGGYLFKGLRDEYNTLSDVHKTLRERHNRVQFGYNQGVLEGMGKAYANVRAEWIDCLDASTPQERAFLLTWKQHPADKWDMARRAINTELKTLTGPDYDVNYADFVADGAVVKHAISGLEN